MFWEIFYNLCRSKGTYPNTVAKELSFSSGSVTFWKNGKIPQYKSLKKIADYFGVSVEYLLGNENGPTNEGEPENGLIICRNGVKENRPMTEEELAAFDAFYNTYMK